MYRVGTVGAFEAGLESAYPVIVPSAQEAMAKRILSELPPSPGAGRLPPEPRRKPRTGRRDPITTEDEKRIRDLIEEWRGPLKWDLLTAEVNKRFRAKWHRQSLANHKRILKAFQDKKLELRKAARELGRSRGKSGESTVEYLRRQLRDAQEYAQELKGQLDAANARFARWQHNAYLLRIDVALLDRPLQENDRGRTD